MELNSMKHIGKVQYFPWQHLDENRWPGRELRWIWCNPVLATVLFISFFGTLILYIAGF